MLGVGAVVLYLAYNWLSDALYVRPSPYRQPGAMCTDASGMMVDCSSMAVAHSTIPPATLCYDADAAEIDCTDPAVVKRETINFPPM